MEVKCDNENCRAWFDPNPTKCPSCDERQDWRTYNNRFLCLFCNLSLNINPPQCPHCNTVKEKGFASSGGHLLEVPREVFQGDIFPCLGNVSSVRGACQDLRTYVLTCSKNIRSPLVHHHNDMIRNGKTSLIKHFSHNFLKPVACARFLLDGRMIFLSLSQGLQVWDMLQENRPETIFKYLGGISRMDVVPDTCDLSQSNSLISKHVIAFTPGLSEIVIVNMTSERIGERIKDTAELKDIWSSSKFEEITNVLFISPETIIFSSGATIAELNIENRKAKRLLTVTDHIHGLAKFSPHQIIYSTGNRIMVLNLKRIDEQPKHFATTHDSHFIDRLLTLSDNHIISIDIAGKIIEWDFPSGLNRQVHKISICTGRFSCPAKIHDLFVFIHNSNIFIYHKKHFDTK